jgi:hypothetical protein
MCACVSQAFAGMTMRGLRGLGSGAAQSGASGEGAWTGGLFK